MARSCAEWLCRPVQTARWTTTKTDDFTKMDKGTSTSTSLEKFVKEMELELATLRKQQVEMDKVYQEMYLDYIQIELNLECAPPGRQQPRSLEPAAGHVGARRLQTSSLASSYAQKA